MRVAARDLEGQRYPSWYGIAWHEYLTDELVLLPIPLNVLARWAHYAYWQLFRFLKSPPPRSWERRAYNEGFRDGERRAMRHIEPAIFCARDEGYKNAMASMEKALTEAYVRGLADQAEKQRMMMK